MVDFDRPENPPQIVSQSRLASGLGFSSRPGAPRTLFTILNGFDAVRDNVRNILFFRKGDYPDDPDFGVGLQDFIFEQNDETLRTVLEREIANQISRYERRATISRLNIYVPDWLDNALVIDLILNIAGTEFRGVATTQGDFTLYSRGAA